MKVGVFMKRSTTIPLTSETQEIIERIERDASRPASSGPVPSRGIAYKGYSNQVGHKKTGKKWGFPRAYFSEK